MNPVSCMPDWYIEVTNGLKQKHKQVSSEKRIIINYLKDQIRQIEEGL